MTFLQTILLGVLQGITEFLPVSSSGHLVLLSNLFGVQLSDPLLFEVLVHLGTLIAIFQVFRKDILHLTAEFIGMVKDTWFNLQTVYFNNRKHEARRYRKIIYNNYRSFAAMILISTIPTVILGYLFRDLVALASEALLVPGIGFLITALLLLVADICESGNKVPKEISMKSALLIGIAQGLSVFPGLSRSGITIAACLLGGFDKRFAVRYSFIMSIPVILGAAAVEVTKIPQGNIPVTQFLAYLAGAAAAGIVGYFCIRKMIGIVRKKSFKGFSAYCLVIGLISLAGYIW